MTAPVNPSAPRSLARRPAFRGPGLRRVLMAAALVAPLSGCALFGAPEEQRGNRVDEAVLKEVTPGVASRADVTALLGSPSATATFDQREWYYISSVTHIRPARTPGVENQQVVVIRFNEAGIVESIERKGEADMRNVAVVERTTPVPGNERSLLQALFGNIGRFGPAPTQAVTPGAPSPTP